MDVWELSSFDKSPKSGKSFVEETELTRTFLKNLKQISDCEIVYLAGNHEFRLRKYLIRMAPELFDLEVMDIESILQLEDLDIEYVDIPKEASSFQDNYILEQNYFVGHFSLVRAASGATAKALVDKYGVNIIQNHVHRGGVFYKRTMDKTLIGIENFCLCSLNPSYIKNPNWMNGYTEIIDGVAIPHHIAA